MPAFTFLAPHLRPSPRRNTGFELPSTPCPDVTCHARRIRRSAVGPSRVALAAGLSTTISFGFGDKNNNLVVLSNRIKRKKADKKEHDTTSVEQTKDVVTRAPDSTTATPTYQAGGPPPEETSRKKVVRYICTAPSAGAGARLTRASPVTISFPGHKWAAT